MKKSTRFVIILIAMALMPGALVAATKYNDIRIVVDVSGSMKKTDPSNLRIPALKLLNGLIPNGSRAGVWTFGRYVNMTVKWGKVDDAWRKKADVGVGEVHSNGLYTNIERALDRASHGWGKSDPDTRRSIILLTDGQVDISKNAEKNELSRRAILTEGIQSLKNRSVEVHAVALSRGADEVLLKQLALETGGSFEVAETAQELQKLFFKMFERATEPDSVKLKGNQFSVDRSIKEMTLLIFRQPGSDPTRLHPPESNPITEKQPGISVWRSDQGYDLITIKKPKSGLWKFDADLDPDNRLMVITDLKLQLDELPAYLVPLEPLEISAQLYNRGKKIKKNNFLRFVDFSFLHIDEGGAEKRIKLKHTSDRKLKGLYSFSFLQGLKEGTHSFVVSADSRTFNRSKWVKIEVQWPVVVSIDPAGEPGNYSLQVKAREEYLKPENLMPTVQMKAPDGTRQDIVMKQSGDAWIATIETNQNGLYQARINIKGETVNGKDIQVDLGKFPMVGVFREAVVDEADPADKTDETTEDSGETESTTDAGETEQTDWVFMAIIVGGANVGLIIIALAIWFFLRRRKTTPELTLEDDLANA